MQRIALGIFVFLAACTAAPPTVVGRAPALGKADSGGSDAADRACQVILRDFARTTTTWTGSIDVLSSLANVSDVGILYRPGTTGTFLQFSAVKGDGGGSGKYTHYTVSVAGDTTTSAEIAVYVAFADGSRLFDHNRVSDDLANYELTPTNDFTIAAAPGICPAQAPRGTLDFSGAFTQTQEGPLVAGGVVTVSYALSRLPTCRYSSQGYQLWDTEANLKFEPSGTVVTRSTTMVAGGERSSVPLNVDIPLGTTSVQLWFRNYNGADSQCETYDSNYGNNYVFAVAESSSASVAWAGNWGGSFSRACTHADGLAEPIVIDEYTRERACKLVDADVYVPGLSDADDQHPERLWADVEYVIDGVAQPTSPLAFVQRVGNNFRYRWTLPYELSTQLDWQHATFNFRFSADGNTYFRIGQADGPAGGAARTINFQQE